MFLLLGRSFIKNCRKVIIEREEKYDEVHGKIEDVLSNLITVYTGKQKKQETDRVIKENKKIINHGLTQRNTDKKTKNRH